MVRFVAAVMRRGLAARKSGIAGEIGSRPVLPSRIPGADHHCGQPVCLRNHPYWVIGEACTDFLSRYAYHSHRTMRWAARTRIVGVLPST
jgi:hypothetical protein